MRKFEVGENVICDLDQKEYTIVSIEDRNLVEKKYPDEGPELIGNIVTLKDSSLNTVHVYDWEISEVE